VHWNNNTANSGYIISLLLKLCFLSLAADATQTEKLTRGKRAVVLPVSGDGHFSMSRVR
jgi:hypothetical protein